ncbi:hypothetical protein [Leifsonia sp. WHRI 6310E]|uniref:hypothetical protein n=1 Tax=Leifsonia sp. WHRI 6310E TaxID=3162562 RepID=UPI0032ECCFA6
MTGSAFGNIGAGFSANLPADDFFLNRVVQMVTRLRDHVERLDAGKLHAADDISVILRALVYRGAGYDILRKLRDRTGHEPAGFLVSRSRVASVWSTREDRRAPGVSREALLLHSQSKRQLLVPTF